MPTRARRICPRCNQAFSAPRCPTCAERAADARPNAVYQTAEWRNNSRAFLRENPTCVRCGARARIADHHPVSRRELLRQRVPDPDAWHRLRPLCHPCHRHETAVNQPSGWNAPRD